MGLGWALEGTRDTIIVELKRGALITLEIAPARAHDILPTPTAFQLEAARLTGIGAWNYDTAPGKRWPRDTDLAAQTEEQMM